ncbi:MAG: hypothetical protein ACYC1D_17100 [Acidimicrobiales bacterium]
MGQFGYTETAKLSGGEMERSGKIKGLVFAEQDHLGDLERHSLVCRVVISMTP